MSEYDRIRMDTPITPPAQAIAHSARITVAEAAIAAGNPGELDGMLRMVGLR